jgi:hypothetical protein
MTMGTPRVGSALMIHPRFESTAVGFVLDEPPFHRRTTA